MKEPLLVIEKSTPFRLSLPELSFIICLMLVCHVHMYISSTAIKKIGDFGAKLKNLLDPRISQLLESFDEVMTNIKRVAIKVSRETVHPEKAVHDIDAIVSKCDVITGISEY